MHTAKRKRSSSLPATTTSTLSPILDRVLVGQSPLALPKIISTQSEVRKGPLSNSIELDRVIGPKHRRSVSDPVKSWALRDLPDVEDGETLCGSRDDDASWCSMEDPWDSERNKDSIRRLYALQELLTTEVGYLQDLKFLVNVYLANLPTLVARSLSSTSTLGRASASFTGTPSWLHSSSSSASSSMAALSDSQNISNATKDSPTPRHSNSRFLFTDHEIEILTRNIEEILHFHEQFVTELCMFLKPLGFLSEKDESLHHSSHEKFQLGNLDQAIRFVSTKFATEASRFNAYQTFCAGHPEAMDVLRKAFQLFPVELDSFEQQCSSIVGEMLESEVKTPIDRYSSPIVEDTSHRPASKSLTVGVIALSGKEDRKRATSLTSLDDGKASKPKSSPFPNALRPRSSMTAMSVISMMSNREKEVAKAVQVDFPTDVALFNPQNAAVVGSYGTNGTAVGSQEKDRDKSTSGARKIAMADYMIKPIQRICKYPLLLDQLLLSKALRRRQSRKAAPSVGIGVDVVVESAAQAMRHVAASVDAAREKQSVAIQSSLIFSRICLGLQVQGVLSSCSFSHPCSLHSVNFPFTNSSSPASIRGPTQPRILTPAFLSSLGPCLISGSLDVIHYAHPNISWSTSSMKVKMKMKAKYLGAFLYEGGYLIFVKVWKGKRYEPRHWFNLHGWDIVGVTDEDAMLPNSIRLSNGNQQFELAAACLREKDAWLASIREALRHVPTWIGEPMPSFMCDGSDFPVEPLAAGSLAPASEDGHGRPADVTLQTSTSADAIGLPTIRSITEVSDVKEAEDEQIPTLSEPFFALLHDHVQGKMGKKRRKVHESTTTADATVTLRSRRHPQRQHIPHDEGVAPRPSSRRSSSSTSVMSIFSPINMTDNDKENKEKETETVLITRSSATARQAIDLELQDVISPMCASARAEAAWKGKMDVNSGMGWSSRTKPGSSVGIGSVGRGMARLSKHESVRVPRKRTSIGVVLDAPSVPAMLSGPAPSNVRVTANKNIKKLSLTPLSSSERGHQTLTAATTSSNSLSPFESDMSDSLSNSVSRVPCGITIEVVPSISPLTTPVCVTYTTISSESASQTQPPRSFVRNVKGLFQFRPVSPAAPPISVIVSQPSQNSLRSVASTDMSKPSANAATGSFANQNYHGHGFLQRFTRDSHRRQRKFTAGQDEHAVVTVIPICEADENIGKEKISIPPPTTAPIMMI